MTTQILHKTNKLLPFTLGFVEPINEELYDEAIKQSETLKQSYDPQHQTSSIPVYAGTSLTYDDTSSGLLLTRDDSEQVDT